MKKFRVLKGQVCVVGAKYANFDVNACKFEWCLDTNFDLNASPDPDALFYIYMSVECIILHKFKSKLC